MRFVMSSFSCFRFGLVGFVLCRLFLVLIRSLNGAGNIEFRVFTCPLGMWCLSAVRIRLVTSLLRCVRCLETWCLRELAQSLL